MLRKCRLFVRLLVLFVAAQGRSVNKKRADISCRIWSIGWYIIAWVFSFIFAPYALASSHVLYFVPPESNQLQQGFIRITNKGAGMAVVAIDAVDDAGNWAINGPLTININSSASKQLNSTDLENGNANKGLLGGLGVGVGNWRLTIDSASSLDVMGYIRTPEGFLNDMHDVAPSSNSNTSHVIYIFNPASNLNQQSTLRLSNNANASNLFTISAIDDAGSMKGVVVLALGSLEAINLTAKDLEEGNTTKGLVGAFGDGAGKWRLNVESELSSTAINLLELPGGYISNLSGATAQPEEASPPVVVSDYAIESTVNGTFDGWDGDTIVQLANGQIWKQAAYYYEYYYAYRPNVVLYNVGTGWKMMIDGTERAVRVDRLQ